MQKDSMAKLSLICSLTGIAVLYAGAVQMRPGLTPIAKIDNDYVGLRTKVSGQVTDLYEHQNGHLFLKLEDDSGGAISVPIFASVRSELGDEIGVLDRVQVTGEVKRYNGKLEIVPEDARDVQVVHTAPTEISEIDQNMLGKLVRTRGVIAELEEIGSGSLVLVLKEGDERLKAFVPASVAREEGFPEIKVNSVVQAVGLLQLYQGELELKVKSAGNLEIVEDLG